LADRTGKIAGATPPAEMGGSSRMAREQQGGSAGTAADATEDEKRSAAEAAALLVSDGMTVGLGTGSTAAYLLPALAARNLRLRCVATSAQTEQAARDLGLAVEPFDRLQRLDLAIDGADQVDPSRWLVKGGGGAHTREKIVAAAAERFVVIVSSEKLVPELHAPVPLELLPFGVEATLEALHPTRLRDAPPSPDGGLIADYLGSFEGAAELARRLDATPGVVEHGLFPPSLVHDVIVGRGERVEHLSSSNDDQREA
jgi:ribose 5-phosphate isomerase A